MFDLDATGIDPDSKGTNVVLPKRWFDFEIVEFTAKDGRTYPLEGLTKNGDPMVSILCEVIHDDEYDGQRVFHTVTFFPAKKPDGTPTPGAGMAIHFLKAIGQPWEGKIKIDPTQWVGAEFQGYVIQDEYNGRVKNKISEIKAMLGDKPASTLPLTEEGVPF